VKIELRGHKAQRRLWRSTRRYVAFVGGLGSGKTFAGACKLLLLPPEARAVVVAPTYQMLRDASQETFFQLCPPALVLSHNRSTGVTRLTQARTIYWRSGEHPDRLRGPNLSHAWIDEAAYCRPDLWPVVLGRLRHLRAQQVWLTTTPDGHNWLYDEFARHGSPAHEVIRAPTRDNAYLPPVYQEELEARYARDPEFAAQELEGAWVDLSGAKRLPAALLDPVTAVRAPLPCPPALLPYAQHLRIYRAPAPGLRVAIGVDPAEGVPRGDHSAAVVVDAATGALCAILAGALEPRRDLPAAVLDLAAHYAHGGAAPTLVERNNHGHAVLAALEASALSGSLVRGHDGKNGYLTGAASKADLYSHAARLLRDGEGALYDQRLRDQLGSVDRATLAPPDKGRAPAVDDEAVAWCLAQWARAQDPGLDWLHRMVR
jgi:hypothetical protein